MICWRCHSNSVNTGSRLPNISDVKTRKRRNVVGIDIIRNNRIDLFYNLKIVPQWLSYTWFLGFFFLTILDWMLELCWQCGIFCYSFYSFMCFQNIYAIMNLSILTTYMWDVCVEIIKSEYAFCSFYDEV